MANVFDVVKLKNGKIGTVLEIKETNYLIEIDSTDLELISVKDEDIQDVIYQSSAV